MHVRIRLMLSEIILIFIHLVQDIPIIVQLSLLCYFSYTQFSFILLYLLTYTSIYLDLLLTFPFPSFPSILFTCASQFSSLISQSAQFFNDKSVNVDDRCRRYRPFCCVLNSRAAGNEPRLGS